MQQAIESTKSVASLLQEPYHRMSRFLTLVVLLLQGLGQQMIKLYGTVVVPAFVLLVALLNVLQVQFHMVKFKKLFKVHLELLIIYLLLQTQRRHRVPLHR